MVAGRMGWEIRFCGIVNSKHGEVCQGTGSYPVGLEKQGSVKTKALQT